jgi:hypothetical protein
VYRTWVSGVGDDVNPCSRTAPCKTFAGAISKTAAGGEINVLDPGAYGAVTITKSISILAEGQTGGVLASGTTGIIINAAATDTVTLRGLDISGAGATPGINGIRIMSAANVHISNCIIRRFTNATFGNGIHVVPTAVSVNVVVNDCRISENKHGIGVDPTATGVAVVKVTNSQIAANTSHGIRSKGAGATAQVSNSVVTGNNFGFFTNGGTIVSFGNNIVLDNDTNGTPTSTVPFL